MLGATGGRVVGEERKTRRKALMWVIRMGGTMSQTRRGHAQPQQSKLESIIVFVQRNRRLVLGRGARRGEPRRQRRLCKAFASSAATANAPAAAQQTIFLAD